MATEVVLYDAKESTFKIGDVISTVLTTSSVYDQITDRVTDGVTKWVRNLTVTGVDRPVELEKFLGQDSNSLPNQSLFNKQHEVVKISGELAYDAPDTDLSMIGMFAGSSGTTIGDGKQYQYGNLTNSAVGLEFTDGTKVIQLALNNARVTKVGEISQEADDYPKATFEMVCVIADFYEYVEA